MVWYEQVAQAAPPHVFIVDLDENTLRPIPPQFQRGLPLDANVDNTSSNSKKNSTKAEPASVDDIVPLPWRFAWRLHNKLLKHSFAFQVCKGECTRPFRLCWSLS